MKADTITIDVIMNLVFYLRALSGFPAVNESSQGVLQSKATVLEVKFSHVARADRTKAEQLSIDDRNVASKVVSAGGS